MSPVIKTDHGRRLASEETTGQISLDSSRRGSREEAIEIDLTSIHLQAVIRERQREKRAIESGSSID